MGLGQSRGELQAETTLLKVEGGKITPLIRIETNSTHVNDTSSVISVMGKDREEFSKKCSVALSAVEELESVESKATQ